MSKYRRTIVTLDDTQNDIDYMLFCVFEKLWPDMISPKPLHLHPLGKNFNGDGRFDICAHVDELDIDENVEEDPLPHVKLKRKVTMIWGDMRRDPDLGSEGFLLYKGHHDIDSITDLLPSSQSVREVWAWFDTQRKMYSFLGDNGVSLSKIGAYTQRYLGINLADNPLHLGCIYVVHYSPIKNVLVETVPAIPAVRCEIDWRTGATREELVVKVREQVNDKQSLQNEFSEHVIGGKSFALVQMNGSPRRVDIDIENINGKTLHFLRDVVFLGSVMTPLSKLPQSKSSLGVATVKSVGLESYLRPAILDQEAKIRRSSLEFVFFDGDPSRQEDNKREAKACVDRILEKAKTKLIIADPYFAAEQFNEYIVPLENVKGLDIMVVNCKDQLEFVAHNQKKAFEDVENELRMAVSSFNSNGKGNSVAIYCITGKGRLHDRFVLTENEGWMIGSSLSEFGIRACCIIKLLDSAHKELSELISGWCADEKVSYKVE